jgi:hypothetical protein
MKENSFLKTLLRSREGELKRVHEDNSRMTESCIGAEEMKDLITGKQTKPRAVRDWERNHEGR